MTASNYRLQQLGVTESTNTEVRKAAEAGEAEGLVIQALRQTAGRGRQGRAWDSPIGNLYISLLLRPSITVRAAGAYSFVAALAVYDAVRSFLPQAEIFIKWPNDVLVSGKKISGLLLETGAAGEDGLIPWLVVGVGINIGVHPQTGLYPTTDLAAEGAPDAGLDSVRDAFLAAFANWDAKLRTDGFSAIRSAWRERARTGHMTARLPDQVLEGDFVHLDEEGRLILRLADGTEKAIAAGDLFFPEAL